MAATVSGTFRIIDRASRPMEGMRREAERLDKALMSVGDHMDEVGTKKHIDQMEKTERTWRDVDRTVTSVGGGSSSTLGRTRSTMRGLGDDSDRLTYRLGRLAAAFSGVQKITKLMVFPAIVTGVVALTQAVGALAGGLVGLAPMLADTVGLLGAMPAALTGVGLAAITAKVALTGLGPALKGTEGAMAALTPRAREFVKQLKELKPIGAQMRSSAQAGMLPGLSDALSTLTRRRPVNTARRALKGMGQTLGDTASQAATAFTRPGFLRDFTSVSRQGEHLMSRFGSTLINVAHALMDVAVAAEPFTSWLAETIQGWSVGWREAAKLNRQTGDMRGFFERTRHSLERFGSIAENLWDTFRGLGRAARPLGEDLWRSADKATERWADFTNSVRGQRDLRTYFNDLKAPLHAMFRLVGGLGEAIMELGASPGLTKTANALTRAIDPLQEAFENIGTHLGPAFAKTVEQLIRLFANLSETSGPFASVLGMLNTFLGLVNGLLESIPGLTNLITGVLGAVALSNLAGRIRGVAASGGLVAGSANAAAAAQARAAASGMASPGFRRGGQGGKPLPTKTPGTIKTPYGPMTSPVPTGVPGKGAFKGALGRVGGFLGPMAAFMGAAGFATTPGDFGERAEGAFSAASFGLIPPPMTGAMKAEQGITEERALVQKLLGEGRGGRAGLQGDIGRLERRRGMLNTAMTGGLEVDGGEQRMATLTAAIRELTGTMREGDRTRGATVATDFQQAFNIESRGQAGKRGAVETLLDPMGKRLQKFAREDAPQAAKAFGASMLRIVGEAKRNNPKLKDEYDRLENSIERSFRRMGQHVEVVNGQIYTGSKREWGRIQEAIGSQAERARQRQHTAFTAMQQEAVGSLVAMGYDRATANKIVQGMERGDAGARRAAGADPLSGQVAPGKLDAHYRNSRPAGGGGPRKGARGMRVPGVGTHDNVYMGRGHIGAPGELLLNRHTEADVDRDLMAVGAPTLGQRVAGERRKHSDPQYGARGMRTGGGITGVGQWASSMGLSVGEGPGFGGGVPSSGHASGSLHYSGNAYDISGAPGAMYKFRRLAEQRYLGRGLNELFYDPYPYYIDAGAKVQGSIGDHSDHVHIGFDAGGPAGANAIRGLARGAGAGAFKRVKRRRSGMGGVPGALADAGMGAYARGLNRRLGQKAGMGAAPGIPRGIGAGGGTLGMGQLEALARGAGMANPHLMAAIAMAESSGNPSVTNSIGARGLWQIIPSTAAAFGLNYNRLTNPAYNAFGAAKILQGQGLGAWEGYTNGAYSKYMATGGRMADFAGWFGKGGTVTANGPTLLGIGDGGPETATITRGTAGGGGKKSVQVHIGKIENNRPGDIQKQLKDEVGKAMAELSEEFDLDIDDEEVFA